MWGDPTRRLRDGTFGLAYEAGGGPCTAYVRQQPGGSLAVSLSAPDEAAAHDRLRWLLAVDVDVMPFLALAREDPLLRDCVPGREGVRPLRLGTVAHALLRALAGQLITSREARAIESAVIRRVSPASHGFHLPPTGAALAALPPAELTRLGLSPRRAATLVRVARSLDLERLHGVPSELVLARLGREPNLGPWSAGVVACEGLGRLDLGLTGDLGLVRIARALLGRQVTTEDTAALLAPYGEWAGLASYHLLAHPLAAAPGPTGSAQRPNRERRSLV